MRPLDIGGGKPEWEAFPFAPVPIGNCGATGKHGGEAAELASPQSRLEVRQLVVVPRRGPAAFIEALQALGAA